MRKLPRRLCELPRSSQRGFRSGWGQESSESVLSLLVSAGVWPPLLYSLFWIASILLASVLGKKLCVCGWGWGLVQEGMLGEEGGGKTKSALPQFLQAEFTSCLVSSAPTPDPTLHGPHLAPDSVPTPPLPPSWGSHQQHRGLQENPRPVPDQPVRTRLLLQTNRVTHGGTGRAQGGHATFNVLSHPIRNSDVVCVKWSFTG